jgi:two-component system sensor histidine kinase KdpD
MTMRWRHMFRSIASIGGVAALTLFFRQAGSFNEATVALGFLLLILLVATSWGLEESIVSSIAAALCFNYFFLPPIGTWTIAAAENWVALFTFLVTSIVASQLSARARNRTAEAIRHQNETERLYSLSRTILLTSGRADEVAQEIISSVRQIFAVPWAALYLRDSDSIFGGDQGAGLAVDQIREVSQTGRRVEIDHGTIVPLSLGGKPIGSLALGDAGLGDAPLHAIANLAAIALERAQSQELASRTEIIRRHEEFKSSLLDALAHEFKTPLTALSAAASALAMGPMALREEQRDLINVVVEEAERLNALVTQAIRMAQIDAGKAKLNREPVLLKKLIDHALGRLTVSPERREMVIHVPGDLEVDVDSELIELALKQYIDNALKYSSTTEPIELTAVVEGSQLKVCVSDKGIGIDELEQQQVFEKYYRGKSSSKGIKGAGIGLSVVRDIVAAHGGKAWLESVPNQGSKFYFTLPLLHTQEQSNEEPNPRGG